MSAAVEHLDTPAGPRVLVVTEDAFFIEEVRDRVLGHGAHLCACLGPAGNRCQLEVRKTCTLVENADIVLVDSPPSGVFSRHIDVISAVEYAEKLADKHPDAWVIVCGTHIGLGTHLEGATWIQSRRGALLFLDWALTSVAVRGHTRVGP